MSSSQNPIETFRGIKYLLCDNWIPHIQLPDNPRYCEIGVFYGANLLRFAELFPTAQIVGIDPWLDYDQYPEYKGKISSVYDDFCANLEASTTVRSNQITICKGFSHDVLPTFEDSSFDIIFIDGNHETEFVTIDAELAYRKVKPGGYIIFDDIDWETVRKAYNMFLITHNNVIPVAIVYCQILCRRY